MCFMRTMRTIFELQSELRSLRYTPAVASLIFRSTMTNIYLKYTRLSYR